MIISDIIDKTKKSIEELYEVQLSDEIKTEAGLLLKMYEFDEDIELGDLDSSSLGELTETELVSIYKFGYKIDGVPHDIYKEVKNAYFLNLSDNKESTLISKLKEVKKAMNPNKMNYIILYFGQEDTGILYETWVSDICNGFISAINQPDRVKILAMNLTTDLSGSKFIADCHKKTVKSISTILNSNITNENVMAFYNKISSHKYYIDEEVCRLLNDETIFYLAYIALKRKIKFIFAIESTRLSFIDACTYLFSGQWCQINEMLRMRQKLDYQRVVVLSNGAPVRYGVVNAVEEKYQMRCIPLKSIINSNSVETLVEIIETEDALVSVDEMFKLTDVTKAVLGSYIKKSGIKFDKEYSAFINLLERLQAIAIRLLRKNLVSVKELIFIQNNNEIYFGVMADTITTISVSMNDRLENLYTRSLGLKSILPTQLFVTEDDGSDDTTMTNYLMQDLTQTELLAIFKNYTNDLSYFGDFCAQGKYDEALLTLKIKYGENDMNFYRLCRAEEPDSIKNFKPSLEGQISRTINLVYTV